MSNRPGVIYTPIQADTRDAESMQDLGAGKSLGRPGQASEVATSFVFLATSDSSFYCRPICLRNLLQSSEANDRLQTDKFYTAIHWAIKHVSYSKTVINVLWTKFGNPHAETSLPCS